MPTEYKVTSRWTISKNWLLTATLNSPLGVRPKTSLDLSDMFEDSVKFKQLRKRIVTQGRPQKHEIEEVGPQDSVSQAGKPSSACGSDGGSSPAKLTPKQLQSALAKLARKTGAANSK